MGNFDKLLASVPANRLAGVVTRSRANTEDPLPQPSRNPLGRLMSEQMERGARLIAKRSGAEWRVVLQLLAQAAGYESFAAMQEKEMIEKSKMKVPPFTNVSILEGCLEFFLPSGEKVRAEPNGAGAYQLYMLENTELGFVRCGILARTKSKVPKEIWTAYYLAVKESSES